MTLDADLVRVAVTGAVMMADTGTTAPTGTGGTTTGFTDLGYIGEDGVELTLPDAGDATPVKAWQNNTTVRTIRNTSDDLPSWTFTLLETKLETVELYFGVTVTQAVSEGHFEYTVDSRGYNAFIVDAVDGAELQRDYIPKGIVSSVGSHTLANGEVSGYEVTIEAELDSTAGYNFKRWATALKTPA